MSIFTAENVMDPARRWPRRGPWPCPEWARAMSFTPMGDRHVQRIAAVARLMGWRWRGAARRSGLAAGFTPRAALIWRRGRSLPSSCQRQHDVLRRSGRDVPGRCVHLDAPTVPVGTRPT